jgi:hypothetical protein
MSSTTKFGAPWRPPRAAANVLRARASRFGLTLCRSLDDIESLTAAIGADLWMTALDARTLDNPSRYGTPAVVSLSAVLSRAAGTPRPHLDAPSDSLLWAPDEVVLRCDLYLDVLYGMNIDTEQVLSRVSSDLSYGSSDHRLATASAAVWDII